MIYKEFGRDTKLQIDTLKKLLKKSCSEKQKKLIFSDLKKIENGYVSEKENAYYLDFHLGDSKNHILLHGLRFVDKGRVAQIDHMLINRIGITLLESKSFTGILNIKQDGSLQIDYRGNIKTFPDPTEQNNRHKLVVKSMLKSYFDVPTHAQFFGGIRIDSKVLMNPRTTIQNTKLPKGYERADKFVTARLEEIDKMGALSMLKVVSTMLTIDKAKELAEFFLQHHQPIEFDYSKKYHTGSENNISYTQEEAPKYNQKKMIKRDTYKCSKCQSSNLEIKWGRNYYFKCLKCGSNIPIKQTCRTPRCRPKTKKRGLNFYKICEHCGIDELFYTNPSQV